MAKAAYGLVYAPAEWFRDVNNTLIQLGMEQRKTEPCAWRLVRWENGRPCVLGLMAHVDDFIISGMKHARGGWMLSWPTIIVALL